MSNDTEFNLTFSCPNRAQLQDVVTYLERKKARWDSWKGRGKNSEELLERVGATSCGAVVSWGFNFGEIREDEEGQSSVDATTWANQNGSNVHITGEQGELADLLEKFPMLSITGSYRDEYGQGEINAGDEW